LPRHPSDHAPSTKAVRTSLAQYVRNRTASGEEMANLMLDIMRGSYKGLTHLSDLERTKLAIEALHWLADRGFGKAPQPVDLDIDVQTPGRDERLQDFTDEELRSIREELHKRALPEGLAQVMEATVVQVEPTDADRA